MIYTCGFYIIDPNNKLLIGHPTNHSPNLWSIPKGICDIGETYIEAAKRELYEETGLIYSELPISKIIELPNIEYKSRKNKTLVSFIMKLSNTIYDSKLLCNSMVLNTKYPFPEIDEFKWININESFSMLHHSQIVNKECILKYLN